MKLKYYLRGLGVGIICTAIIMGIALSGQKKEKLTDAEIVERARLLGMIMAEESDSENEEDDKENQKKDSQKEIEQEGNQKQEADNKNAEDKEEKKKQKPDTPSESDNQVPVPEDVQGEPELKTIEIVSGDYSDVVSQKLFEAGLIPDAGAFNSYLTETGADRGITVGIHKIPVGASQEEIIKILGEKSE